MAEAHLSSEHGGDPIELNRLGMWLFLASEVLFFGSLFTAYIVYRMLYPEGFAEASQHLNMLLGGVNTGILLTSSFTMALAVNAAQRNRHKTLLLFLVLTLILGIAFLGLKAFEYRQEFNENLFPGGEFLFPEPYTREARLFFSLYFTMTGLHAVHMIAGLGIITTLIVLAWRNHFSSNNYSPVDLTGLYWHFVDIVWIFLFPLLYLIHS